MPGMNIFDNDAFSLTTLTAAINERDFVPSMIRNMNLFRSRGVTTTTIAIERKGTELKLIPTSPRGAPPGELVTNKANLRDLRIPHLAKNATVVADEVQNVRAFGTDDELQTVQDLVIDRTELLAQEFDLTEEHLMLGALQGKIYDADGTTLIYDLFSEFGVSQPAAIDFALDTDATKVRTKCTEVIRTMGKNMKAGGMQFGVGAIAEDSFFDALINHPDVERAYERFQEGAALRNDYTWQSFQFAGINFINYRGSDDGKVGLAEGECRFFPMGVPGVFEIVYAPADYADTVNTVGLPRYVVPNLEDTGNNRYRKFEVQANPLPYCTRPQTLLRGTA
ncbi:major capsid protein [Salinisphaera sp. T31B1]|uniref:major capsid protein n=1 Tax=Salinisphaera sp. T31B1 TaxID=727963 RepID=UPI00333FBF69